MPSPSKYRSRSRSAKKKTPAKKPSKSPGRGHKKPISKTPTETSHSRSRSTSRSRKANTAPASSSSVRRRSRSRSKAKQGTPKAAVKRTHSRGHSKSPPKQIPQKHQIVSRRAAPSYVPPTNRPKSRNAGGVYNQIAGGVRSVVGRNYVAARIRRAYNRPSGQKVRKHFRLHWKHYVVAVLAVFLAIAVYKFSHEIVTNLRQISKSVSEYAQYQYENKRKIFGVYLEQAQEALDEAKRRYLNNDDSSTITSSPPTPTPAHVTLDKPNDSKQAINREIPPSHPGGVG